MAIENTNPQIIFSWRAPLRAYKKKSAGVLRFYIALGLLLSLISILFGDIILLFPIWAIFFLFYVLTITPSPRINNKITKFGIESGENIYRWDVLSHFYFLKKFEYHQLILVSHPPFISHVSMIIEDDKTKSKITQLLSEHLVYKENPEKTFPDRLTEWLTYLMPEEKETTTTAQSTG